MAIIIVFSGDDGRSYLSTSNSTARHGLKSNFRISCRRQTPTSLAELNSDISRVSGGVRFLGQQSKWVTYVDVLPPVLFLASRTLRFPRVRIYHFGHAIGHSISASTSHAAQRQQIYWGWGQQNDAPIAGLFAGRTMRQSSDAERTRYLYLASHLGQRNHHLAAPFSKLEELWFEQRRSARRVLSQRLGFATRPRDTSTLHCQSANGSATALGTDDGRPVDYCPGFELQYQCQCRVSSEAWI